MNPKDGSDGGHQFQLFSSNQTTRCTVCDKILWGLYDQGYNCSLCQQSCHKICITNAERCTTGKSRSHTYDGVGDGGITKTTVMKRNPVKTCNTNSVIQNNKPTYIALCDYNADPHPGGSAPILSFVMDDEITIVSSADRDWWEGMNTRTKQMGLFPSRNVALKSQQPSMSYMDVQIGQFQPPNRQQQELPRKENLEDFHHKLNLSNLTEQPWYVGKMSRHEAEQILDTCENGVFLMRESDQRPGEYALAVRYEDAPKHIRILYNPKTRKYFMVEAQPFPSLVPLVDYYQAHSLNVCFQGINTSLQKPYWSCVKTRSQRYMGNVQKTQPTPQFIPSYPTRPIHKMSAGSNKPPPPPKIRGKLSTGAYCMALYDFEPNDHSELAFRTGQNIKIINKETEHIGWWMGESEGRVGLFPANYVRLNEFSM